MSQATKGRRGATAAGIAAAMTAIALAVLPGAAAARPGGAPEHAGGRADGYMRLAQDTEWKSGRTVKFKSDRPGAAAGKGGGTGAGGEKKGAGSGQPQDKAGSPADKSPQEIVANLDKDGDGRISRAEWQGAVAFELVDADKDGFVTVAEIAAWRYSAAARKDAGAQ